MENRRGDKIVEIEEYLDNLREYLPDSFDKYMSDGKGRLACERCFEKIVEAVVDLVVIVEKEKDFRYPGYDREAFEILAENKLISKELSFDLGNAKSMRNWLAHRYGKINNKKVFDAMTNKLFKDVEEILEAVR